jgi:hypothetical protein
MRVSYTNKDQRSKFCQPYKYLITGHGGTSKTAFIHTHAFKRWLRERGLNLVKSGKQGAKIIGDYSRVYCNHNKAEFNIKGLKTMVLSNGDYVPCIIKDGVEYVHHTGICTKKWDQESTQERLNEHRKLQKRYG